MKTRTTIASFGVGLALGCSSPAPLAPHSLDQLVVEDPDFSFSTSVVRGVDVAPVPDASAPAELRTETGALLLQGAFRDAARVDLRLPLGTTRLSRAVDGRTTEVIDVDASTAE